MSDEFRAGLVARIMKFVTACVASKMRFILRREKSALVMIEPPRQLVGGRVLEVDNNIVAGPEKIFTDVLAGLVGQALVFDFRSRIDVSFVKAREHGRRRDAVETIVVIKNPYSLHLS